MKINKNGDKLRGTVQTKARENGGSFEWTQSFYSQKETVGMSKALVERGASLQSGTYLGFPWSRAATRPWDKLKVDKQVYTKRPMPILGMQIGMQG